MDFFPLPTSSFQLNRKKFSLPQGMRQAKYHHIKQVISYVYLQQFLCSKDSFLLNNILAAPLFH